MKKIDSIDDGIGSPDWKLSLCLLLAWIVICAILVKGVIYIHLHNCFSQINLYCQLLG